MSKDKVLDLTVEAKNDVNKLKQKAADALSPKSLRPRQAND